MDIIKNYLTFYGGINYRIPPQVEVLAREMIGNQAVDEALSTEYSAQKLEDLKKLSKEEYMAKYDDPNTEVNEGDVFGSSINILGLPDSSFMGAELSDVEKEELKQYEKKLKGN